MLQDGQSACDLPPRARVQQMCLFAVSDEFAELRAAIGVDVARDVVPRHVGSSSPFVVHRLRLRLRLTILFVDVDVDGDGRRGTADEGRPTRDGRRGTADEDGRRRTRRRRGRVARRAEAPAGSSSSGLAFAARNKRADAPEEGRGRRASARFFRGGGRGRTKTIRREVHLAQTEDRPCFAHDRLDVYRVAREALVAGDALARRVPRGYGGLADQLRRALLSLHLNIAEAASRDGADRVARFRTARGECSEAAAAAEAAGVLRARCRGGSRGAARIARARLRDAHEARSAAVSRPLSNVFRTLVLG